MTVQPGELVEWQRRDPETGLVQPWFTHPSLDVIQTWNLIGRRVLEWGGGSSTLWWASRGALVTSVETKSEWCDWIRTHTYPTQVTVIQRTPEEIAAEPVPAACPNPRIVVIDGAERLACLRAALALPRPLTIVFDNWQQDFVFLSEEAARIMEPYEGEFYVQPNHTNHEGRPWQTAIWHLDGGPP